MCYRLAGKHVTLMGGKVIAYKLHSNGAARRGTAASRLLQHPTSLVFSRLICLSCYTTIASIEFSSWLIACAHQLLRVGDPWGSKRCLSLNGVAAAAAASVALR